MTQFRLIVLSIIFAFVPWPALAASGHYSISAEQIAATVGGMGVRIAPSQITLLADVVANTPTPALQVRFLERFDANRFMARLECANKEDCLPFMVSIQADRNGATQLASFSSRQSFHNMLLPGAAARQGRGAMVIRSGSPAMLELDGEHVHIRIPVICLENGSAGQTIRATGKDHRQIYAAQVVDHGILRGRL
jgi:hypothetical protein